jgi:hypothetical protein
VHVLVLVLVLVLVQPLCESLDQIVLVSWPAVQP